MIEIKGKSGIVAKILADSVNEQGNRLTTFELTYPRMVHSEILTHKMLCSNSASSRAIPFAKMAEQLTAMPVRFGQANPGMQDKGEDYQGKLIVDDAYQLSDYAPEEVWGMAQNSATKFSKVFYEAGFHKQVYNRLTEPFQMMKTVISGTEWDNFFWLRKDSAADPTLHELARCMQEARDESVPQLLKAGQYHLPYIDSSFVSNVQCMSISKSKFDENGFAIGGYIQALTVDEAIKVSCARTAAISFRNEDYGLEKCLEVYARLIGDERKHSSAMQHAATPMQKEFHDYYDRPIIGINDPMDSETWEQGISHADREGNLWSAQYKGFIMHRKTIPGENYVKDSK